MQHPDKQTGRGNLLIWAVLVLVNLVVLRHLAGSVGAAAVFVSFLALTFIPAVTVTMRLMARTELPDDLKGPCAVCAVFVLLVPWFFIRKAVGAPVLLDSALSLMLLGTSWRGRGAFRELGRNLQAERLWLFAVIPLCFATAWLGWAVNSPDETRFYGLYVIDFGNLASVVTSVRSSPMLPQSLVDGGGPLSYHWLYFAVPALLAEWMGFSLPNPNALILMNLIAAIALFYTVRMFAATVAQGRNPSVAAAFVLFAPSSVYLHQALAYRFELGWLEIPSRNHLLLTPLNSMIVFGNNTVALILCAIVVWSTHLRVRTGGLIYSIVAAVSLALMAGYSVTLLFPIASGVAAALLMSGPRKAIAPLVVHGAIGIAALSGFALMGLFDSPASGGLAASFDGGAFVRTVLMGMLPLWVVASLGWRPGRPSAATIVAAACLLVPSVLYIEGTATGHVDFSMKSAALMPVLLVPAAARAVASARVAARLAMVMAMAVGAIHSAAYVGQYAYYRLYATPSRSVALRADYYAALSWLRRETSRGAIVLDAEAPEYSQACLTAMVGERRVWLPQPGVSPQFAERPEAWARIAKGRANPEDIRLVEGAVDYVLTATRNAPAAWRRVFSAGDISIFELSEPDSL